MANGDDTEEMQDNDVPVTDQNGNHPTLPPPQPPTMAMTPVEKQVPLTGPVPPGTAITSSITGGVRSPVTTFVAGPRPPTDPRQELYRRQAASNAQLWKNLQSRTANLPIAQTEEAVAAAMRFQGQRQYQRDLASGIPQAEAFARAAPLMFNAPKQSNLGQAAAFTRAITPEGPKFMNAGGVIYRIDPNATQGRALTPRPVAKPEPPNRFDTEEYASILREITSTESKLDDIPLTSPRAEPLRAKRRQLSNQLQTIRNRSQAPTTRSATGGKRIRVRHPNGKFGTIPESQLEAAKAAGYMLVK